MSVRRDELPIDHPYAALLKAARHVMRAYGEKDEGQALLELGAAIGDIDTMLDRQDPNREPPEWLTRR